MLQYVYGNVAKSIWQCSKKYLAMSQKSIWQRSKTYLVKSQKVFSIVGKSAVYLIDCY